MTFKAGQSGNPKGRAKGSTNKRTQLGKLLEPHAEKLITKMIELALGGDVTALRLCIERLIPKVQQEPIGIGLPTKLNDKNLPKLKNDLVLAALEGRVSVGDIEKLIKLIHEVYEKPASQASMPEITKDMTSIEAAKIYQQIMMMP